jgi:hypothetical protein
MWLQPGPSIPLELSQRALFRDRFLPGYPLVWVEDAATGMLWPFWVPHCWFSTVAESTRAADFAGLDPEIACALRWAGVLVDPARRRELLESKRAMLASAREQFQSRGYANLGNLMHAGVVTALQRYYRQLTEDMKSIGDAQCDRRYGIHNETMARFLHRQFTCAAACICGEAVRPSYCYFAGYREGAVLARHRDREQCEFSISLLIDYDPAAGGAPSWPLWLETESGPAAVHQSAGDALFYGGRKLPHWRTELSRGSRSHSLLLHYVGRDFNGPLR